METMENFRERLGVLEQQTKAMEAHTHTVEQRLRWWRGIACGVVMLALFSLALPSGKAADAPGRGMAERMATMEKKLAAMDFDDAANEVVISGANLRIVNGLGATDTTNALGNLIVGYNEPRGLNPDVRTGSHNVVIGQRHNFSRFGGLVVGDLNTISGDWASVSGGHQNTASGLHASISGGCCNNARNENASVSGGDGNTADGANSAVSGGSANIASGFRSWIGGGDTSEARGSFAVVSGGLFNRATGIGAVVSGGVGNTASGVGSSVSGGDSNTASGELSSVSGGFNRTAPGQFNWAAGALFSDQ